MSSENNNNIIINIFSNNNSSFSQPSLINNKYDYLISTLNSFKQNINTNIKESESKVIPFEENLINFTHNIKKIGNNVTSKINLFIFQFKEYLKLIDIKINFINELKQSNINQDISLSLISEECKINSKVIQNQKKILHLLESIIKLNKILNNLINSEYYKDFMNIFKLNEDSDETESIELLSNSNIYEKTKDKNNINNENKDNKNEIKVVKKFIGKKRKNNNINEIIFISSNVKKKKKINLLQKLKKKFPNNDYIKKITKTFLQRRLNHFIIYSTKFILNKNNNNIEENKIKSSGDKTNYKFIKFNFELNIGNNGSNLINNFKEKFNKGFFIKKFNNFLELSGKFKNNLIEFLKKFFILENFIKFGFILCEINAYEFFEELSNEYFIDNLKENEVINVLFNEKMIKKLKENYKNLIIVREFIKKLKNK